MQMPVLISALAAVSLLAWTPQAAAQPVLGLEDVGPLQVRLHVENLPAPPATVDLRWSESLAPDSWQGLNPGTALRSGDDLTVWAGFETALRAQVFFQALSEAGDAIFAPVLAPGQGNERTVWSLDFLADRIFVGDLEFEVDLGDGSPPVTVTVSDPVIGSLTSLIDLDDLEVTGPRTVRVRLKSGPGIAPTAAALETTLVIEDDDAIWSGGVDNPVRPLPLRLMIARQGATLAVKFLSSGSGILPAGEYDAVGAAENGGVLEAASPDIVDPGAGPGGIDLLVRIEVALTETEPGVMTGNAVLTAGPDPAALAGLDRTVAASFTDAVNGPVRLIREAAPISNLAPLLKSQP